MRRIIFAGIELIILVIACSCGSSEENAKVRTNNSDKQIKQQADGIIDLNIEKASCYNDNVNPSSNTAEWEFIVSKAGRFKVWLSTATKDTMDLQYPNSVKISLLDERLEGKPVGDTIVLNASDVKYPYYRADSYMGTFYIQEPGSYSIQVISEKVPPKERIKETSSLSDPTKLMSVILTPMTR
jgi:hypothetical protein